MSPADLARIEKELGINLPRSYRDLILNRAEHLKTLTHDIGGQTLSWFNDLLFLDAQQVIDVNLAERQEDAGTEEAFPGWSKHFFLVGTNGAGDYYCLRLTGDTKVWMIGSDFGAEPEWQYDRLIEFVDCEVQRYHNEAQKQRLLVSTQLQLTTPKAMLQQVGLFKSVVDNPDDDTLRLICADWLEEHGEGARAEYIRAEIEEARLPFYDDPRYKGLLERQQELYREHGWIWLEEVPQWIPRDRAGPGWFRRGFIGFVTCTVPEFLERAGALFQEAPIQEALLGDADAHVEALAGSPYLGRMCGLSFHSGEHGDRLMSALANSSHASRLTQLDVSSHQVTVNGARTLADSPYLPPLTMLSLANNPIGAEGANALAVSPLLPAVKQLSLGWCQLGNEGVLALVAQTNFKHLKWLFLGGNQIGPPGAKLLAGWPVLGQVRWLSLGNNPFGTAGFKALAASPYLSNLTILELERSTISDEAAEALAAAPHLGSLTDLSVYDSELSSAALDCLRDRFGEVVRTTMFRR